jgi:hypothetical protein
MFNDVPAPPLLEMKSPCVLLDWKSDENDAHAAAAVKLPGTETA